VATFGVDKLGAQIRRRGVPARPVVAVQTSEIRSDQFVIPLPTLEPPYTEVAIAQLVIEWSYSVPYQRLREFQAFLAENDPYITEGCKSVMKGVSYHGTYLGAGGQRNLYRTIWGYESLDALREWTKVVGDASSRLFQVVRKLRSYWTADPHGTQQSFVYAADLKIEDYPFLDLTVRSSEEG
jgi:hypothetical protein